ncbi:MAG: hypothetical protein U0165_14000 [Polyangiaceae bacterium]
MSTGAWIASSVAFSLALSVAGWLIQYKLVAQETQRSRELREVERALRDAEREMAVLRARQEALGESASRAELGERETLPAVEADDPTTRGRSDIVREQSDLLRRREELSSQLGSVERLLTRIASSLDLIMLRRLGLRAPVVIETRSMSVGGGRDGRIPPYFEHHAVEIVSTSNACCRTRWRTADLLVVVVDPHTRRVRLSSSLRRNRCC